MIRLLGAQAVRPGRALDVETGRQHQAGERVLHVGLRRGAPTPRRPEFFTKKRTEFSPIATQTVGETTCAPVGIERLCVSVFAFTKSVSLPATTFGAAGKRPARRARLEAAARHQEVGVCVAPGRERRGGRTGAAVRQHAGDGREHAGRGRGRRAGRRIAQPSADGRRDERDGTGESARRRAKACRAMVAYSWGRYVCHHGTPGSPLAPRRRGDQITVGGSSRHPVRGFLREQERYRPPEATTLSGRPVTSVTLRDQFIGRRSLPVALTPGWRPVILLLPRCRGEGAGPWCSTRRRRSAPTRSKRSAASRMTSSGCAGSRTPTTRSRNDWPSA